MESPRDPRDMCMYKMWDYSGIMGAFIRDFMRIASKKHPRLLGFKVWGLGSRI